MRGLATIDLRPYYEGLVAPGTDIEVHDAVFEHMIGKPVLVNGLPVGRILQASKGPGPTMLAYVELTAYVNLEVAFPAGFLPDPL